MVISFSCFLGLGGFDSSNGSFLGKSLVSQEFGVDSTERRVPVALGSLDTVAVSLFVLVVVGVILYGVFWLGISFIVRLLSQDAKSPCCNRL